MRSVVLTSAFCVLPSAFFFACASTHDVGTSSAPSTEWTAPPSAVPPQMPTQTPADLGTLTMAKAVDVALQNNPATRVAWFQARQAQAVVGSRASAYYPELDLGATFNKTRQATQGGRTIFNSTTFGPSFTISYLLFDVGGRAATVEEARQLLIAANYTHNQQIQNTILAVEQAYFGYMDAKALVDAQEGTIKERQAELDAAQERHRAGVATINDVLQAQTALSQAQLTYETLQQNLLVFQGTLATTMGLAVTTKFTVGTLPTDVPMQAVTTAVDSLIAQAETQRPDFAASRAQITAAEARVREARAEGLPTIGLTATGNRTTFRGFASGTANPYSLGIAMRFPLFTGWRTQYDVRAAQAGVDIAREDARSLQEQIDLEVWSSYYGLSTASQRVRTSRDFLSSAQQAADVAQGRYRSGVGSILDVLTAEAALESARAQEIQARTDWFVAVAQLAHDTGSLTVPQETR
ncbi:MAG TPA: TolC family protein [Thermoanaerobaculia bacterium]|nr:TolC family protein [Thermoanaerobaculia bacterium]